MIDLFMLLLLRDWQLLLGDVDHALCTYLAAEKQVQPILFSYAAVETISTEESNEHPVVDSNVDVIAIDLSCSVTQPIVNHVRFNGDVSDSDHVSSWLMLLPFMPSNFGVSRSKVA
jgi:hypothetical protein